MANKNIFRKYDIRGVYGSEITPELAYKIGFCFGKNVLNKTQSGKSNKVIIGFDGRLSSVEMSNKIIDGLCNSGCNVINIGLVATPVLYFADHKFNAMASIMVTGSHNPKEYNGMKIMCNGQSFFDQDIQDLYHNIISSDFKLNKIIGLCENYNITEEYIDFITKKIKINKDLKVIFDCGNGATGEIVSSLVNKLNFTNQPIILYKEIDGNFPNHHPDPSCDNNLLDLQNAIKENNADIGIAFDGDGDRIGVVDGKGNIINIDKLIMIYIQNIMFNCKQNSTFVLDIKCSLKFSDFVQSKNNKLIISRTGHSYIKQKMKQENAIFAAEASGHIFFKDKYIGYDDGIYSSLRILEILSTLDKSLMIINENLPEIYTTTKTVLVSDEEKFKMVEKFKEKCIQEGLNFLDIDGVKIISQDESFLVRPSNTQPAITLTCEGKSKQHSESLFEKYWSF